jgi:hypothetical protein
MINVCVFIYARKRLTRYEWNFSVIFSGIIPSNSLARLGNPTKAESWEKLCRIIRHLQWRRARDMKLNADAPPLQFRLPESRPGGQSQNYFHQRGSRTGFSPELSRVREGA